ncbi:hypothetical protein P170DRAFT_464063 [Aspergillus steynii IBT 23096]|uniref:Uncharacterized protein n=1 Tax=Aspergillus steynii IBT 23096 TaxID=1392250 RepID=A0A2I2GDS7_9EURO|nr:uncharacterized protein P170DRAFT_464063 [Aspergillus steynii IBT 23096]PLB51054.1 hypothetical protein P170DRAFT_464063 [Aspergillus steynii IBT 23096]
MTRDHCDVPIVLSMDHLEYEDIAKLNPFYDELKTFWEFPSDITYSSLSSSASSGRDSFQSIPSEVDMVVAPLEVSPSPPMRYIKPATPVPAPEKARVVLHDGNEYKTAYTALEKPVVAQVAIVEYEEHFKQPMSPVKVSSDSGELDLLEFNLIDNPFKEKVVSHKRLFGENGWLGNTPDMRCLSNEKHMSKTFINLGKKIKHQVEEFAEDMAKVYPIPFARGPRPFRMLPGTTIPISLNPPMQAKMYSELEVMICVTANDFLFEQHGRGRVSEESIRKVTSFWESKNRPHVVEFQFDQATQRRLILSNIRTLQFNGESSTNPILLHSNLRNWKAIVQEMSVRTFCAPDSAIRKHMHDIDKLLGMLGAPTVTLLAFQELQMKTLAMMKKNLEERYSDEKGKGRSSRPRNGSTRDRRGQSA